MDKPYRKAQIPAKFLKNITDIATNLNLNKVNLNQRKKNDFDKITSELISLMFHK